MTEPLSYDLDEIVPAVEEELYSRLDVNLSSKDRLAVTSALHKMGARSFQRGIAMAVASANRAMADLPGEYSQVIAEAEFPHFGEELVDLWAEQYG